MNAIYSLYLCSQLDKQAVNGNKMNAIYSRTKAKERLDNAVNGIKRMLYTAETMCVAVNGIKMNAIYSIRVPNT